MFSPETLRQEITTCRNQPTIPLEDLLTQVKGGATLTWREMVAGMCHLIEGEAPEETRLAFLRELRPERATGEMLAAAAGVLRALAPHIPHRCAELYDCVGTGGDRLSLFNLSTVSALVVAAAGMPVAKHGNRAITSGCGAADLLAELGVDLKASPEQAAEQLAENKITFLFAPHYHSATRNVQPLRLRLKEEGFPTLFNLLGPLSNPAAPTHYLLGVFRPDLLTAMAEAIQFLGCQEAWVVTGSTGTGSWMDEVSPCADTTVFKVTPESITETTLDPGQADLQALDLGALTGGDAATNATLARSVLVGEDSPYLEAVLLNAAVGLTVTGQVPDLETGASKAREVVLNGAAAETLERWVRD